MFKLKIIISVIVFSSLLIFTSMIKNQSREIEKNIVYLNNKILLKEKDLNESQLDFFYLTSPEMIEKKIINLDKNEYSSMEYSKIFLDLSSFINLKNKFATQKNLNEKKEKKK